MIVNNVLFAFGTTEADEPHFRDSFLAGYLLAYGSAYTGAITVENDIFYNYTPMYARAVEANCQVIIRNTGNSPASKVYGDYYYNTYNMQLIAGAGSNNYHSSVRIEPITYEIICGAGTTENLTGYRINIFDIDPYATSGHISSITQSAPNRITIVTDTNPNFYSNGYAVTISGITGAYSSLNGTQVILDNALGTTIEIAGTLSGGSYTGNGLVTLQFSSYSIPYIAGQLCGLANRLNCSLYEAKYRLFITAIPIGTSLINGYGKLDIVSAIAYSGGIPPDPYNYLVGTPVLSVLCVGGYCELTITGISYALTYELYNRGVLIASYNKGENTEGTSEEFATMTTTIERGTSSQPNSFQVKALRGSQYIWSNVVNVPYNAYEKIIVNNNQ